MQILCLIVILAVLSGGCASSPNYDPVAAATKGTFELNATALSNVKKGMTQDQVHDITGQEVIIGYSYEKDSLKGSPITIPNPYKTSAYKGPQGDCTVEYYVTSVHQPDGIVSDDEMMPLLFCQGTLVKKGWEHIK